MTCSGRFTRWPTSRSKTRGPRLPNWPARERHARHGRVARDGVIHVRQGKTNVKRRIAVVGDLKTVLARIAKRKRGCEVHHTRLIVDEDGRPLQKDPMRYRFDKARELAGIPKAAFQFRDLRAKAATDKAEAEGDIRQAQKLAGHAVR